MLQQAWMDKYGVVLTTCVHIYGEGQMEDVAILKATMMEARGNPVAATFEHLLLVLKPLTGPDGGPRTPATIQRRYEWLRSKLSSAMT